MFKSNALVFLASALLAVPAAINAQVTPTAAGKGNTVSADQLVQRYGSFAGNEGNAKSLVGGLRNGADITLTGKGPDVPVFENVQVGTKQVQVGTQTVPIYETQPVYKTVPIYTVQMLPCKPPQMGLCPTQVQTGSQQVQVGTQQVQVGTQQVPVYETQPVFEKRQVGTKPGPDISLTFPPGAAAPMGLGNVDIALALTEARLRPNATPTPQQLKDGLMDILNKRAAGDGWGKIARSYGFQLQE